MKKLITLISLLFVIVSFAIAGNVSGYVTDVETGEPVFNAKVHFTTNDGQHICFDAYTDINGFYSMDILNETYNGRALKSTEYRVTLIENIEVHNSAIVVNFELNPTNGKSNKFIK